MPNGRHRTSRDRNSGRAREPLPQPYPETSYEYPDASGTHDVEDGEDEEEDVFDVSGGRAKKGEGGDDAASETSSAMLDPISDPAGFAKRLNELAGELEVGEKEARAMRWGPDMSARKDDQILLLPIPAFKELINHHLAATEWRYAPDPASIASGQNNGLGLPTSAAPAGVTFENHPIRIVPGGSASTVHTREADVAANTPQDGDVQMATTAL